MEALAQHNWHGFHQPLLNIQPVGEHDPNFHDVKNKVMNLDEYDIVITVTSNASTLAYEWIDQYWPQLPLNPTWFAVGKSSAKPLLRLGMNISCPDGHHSEGLLALPALQDMQHKKVLILRGKGGRELIAQTLSQRGASVSYAEFYQRTPVDISDGALSALLTKQQIHYALVTSGEMAQQLATGLNSQARNALHLIIPSQRIYDNLMHMGLIQTFAGVHVCNNLDADYVISFLESLYQKNSVDERPKQ
jgi:uroporphyrinogen-III synthase